VNWLNWFIDSSCYIIYGLLQITLGIQLGQGVHAWVTALHVRHADAERVAQSCHTVLGWSPRKGWTLSHLRLYLMFRACNEPHNCLLMYMFQVIVNVVHEKFIIDIGVRILSAPSRWSANSLRYINVQYYYYCYYIAKLKSGACKWNLIDGTE